MALTTSGHFVEGSKGPLFVLRRWPQNADRCVLIVPPFAEEMNKSRRMVTLLASRFASRGIATILPDLFGTGDSAGEFVEAEWPIWRTDLERCVLWSAAEGAPVTGVLGIRLGCALACEAFACPGMPRLHRSAFWQPVLDGARYVSQFLRLRTASSMASGLKETVSELRQRMAEAGELEVGGYRLSARLANEIEALKHPVSFPDNLGEVACFELIRESQQRDSSDAQSGMATVKSHGAGCYVVKGEPFWAATEIVTNAELLARTDDFLSSAASAGAPA